MLLLTKSFLQTSQHHGSVALVVAFVFACGCHPGTKQIPLTSAATSSCMLFRHFASKKNCHLVPTTPPWMLARFASQYSASWPTQQGDASWEQLHCSSWRSAAASVLAKWPHHKHSYHRATRKHGFDAFNQFRIINHIHWEQECAASHAASQSLPQQTHAQTHWKFMYSSAICSWIVHKTMHWFHGFFSSMW